MVDGMVAGTTLTDLLGGAPTARRPEEVEETEEA